MNWLSKIKVIDLSTVLAGPSVASFLGELGAKVIKFESPLHGGDITRSWRTPHESGEGISSYFASINYCKSYSTLDLSKAEDRQKLLEELKDTDVLISNFKTGDAAKFGIEASFLSDQFPRLIQAEIIGFTSDAERVAYDVVLQAECGMMAMNGEKNGGPLKFPLAIVDVLAAHQLKEGILLALYQRGESGKGSRVVASLEKSGMSSLINQASHYMMTGVVPERIGSLHPNIAPYGEHFLCADGEYIVLAIGSDQQFGMLVDWLQRPELKEDAKYVHNPARVINREELGRNLSDAIAKVTSSDLMKACRDRKIPVGLLRTMPQVMDMANRLNMVHEETIDGQKTRRMKTVAFEMQ